MPLSTTASTTASTTSPDLPDDHPGLRLLVVQPTALCNLDCTYCYVPDRLNARRLPIALLEHLVAAVRASHLAERSGRVTVLWHAGEPLAAGIAFFEEALGLVNEGLGDRLAVRHAIQTNGTLITDEWCRLFRRMGISIGVSLDGPEDLHDAQRKSRGGGGSFSQVMRGIERLRAHDIAVSTLSVISGTNIGHARRMFEFFVENGLTNVGFNVEETEGAHAASSLAQPDAAGAETRGRYAAFMATMLRLNRETGWPLRIREFASIAGDIERRRLDSGFAPIPPETRLGAILTMTRDGEVLSWSPELASGTPDDPNRFSLGHITSVSSIDELLSSPKARAIQHEIDRGVALCRQQCSYFGLCGGGSPANKFYEHGTFAVTDTLKCRLQVQELAEVILDDACASPTASLVKGKNR